MSDDLGDLVERASTPRRLNRPPVNIPVVVEAGGRRIDGLGRDINEHGLRLRSSDACAPGERVLVRLRPPGFDRPLAIAAEVRWARPEGGPRLHCLGLEFVHTDDTRRAVRRLLVLHARQSLPAIRRSGHTTRRRVGTDSRISKRKTR
jgi:hypothetical protein